MNIWGPSCQDGGRWVEVRDKNHPLLERWRWKIDYIENEVWDWGWGGGEEKMRFVRASVWAFCREDCGWEAHVIFDGPATRAFTVFKSFHLDHEKENLLSGRRRLLWCWSQPVEDARRGIPPGVAGTEERKATSDG